MFRICMEVFEFIDIAQISERRGRIQEFVASFSFRATRAELVPYQTRSSCRAHQRRSAESAPCSSPTQQSTIRGSCTTAPTHRSLADYPTFGKQEISLQGARDVVHNFISRKTSHWSAFELRALRHRPGKAGL